MPEATELQQQINRKITVVIPPGAWDCTVAIAIAIDKTIHQFGTGTLFAIADHHFIVTAAHVIKQAIKKSKVLAISSATGSFIQVVGDWQVSSAGQYGSIDDPLDVAIFRLPVESVQRLQGKTFLRLDDIDFDDQSPTAVFTLFGFPAIWTKPSTNPDTKLSLKPLEFTAYRYQGRSDSLANYQDFLHLLLDAQPEQVTGEDGAHVEFKSHNGVNANFPVDLGGISGCSVWRIGNLGQPIDEWTRTRPRIVGVETGAYHSVRVLKATRWVAVSTLIHEAFPALRPAMALWRQR